MRGKTVLRLAGRAFVRIRGALLLLGGGLLLFLLLVWAALLHSAATPEGRAWLAQKAGNFLSGPEMTVRMNALGGTAEAIEVEGLELADAGGTWLTLEKAELRLDLAGFISSRLSSLEISKIRLQHPVMERLPRMKESESTPQTPLSNEEMIRQIRGIFLSPPAWLPRIVLREFEIQDAEAGRGLLAALPKEAAGLDRFSLHASGEIQSRENALIFMSKTSLSLPGLKSSVALYAGAGPDHTAMVLELDADDLTLLPGAPPGLAGKGKLRSSIGNSWSLTEAHVQVEFEGSYGEKTLPRLLLGMSVPGLNLASPLPLSGNLLLASPWNGDESYLKLDWLVDEKKLELSEVEGRLPGVELSGDLNLTFAGLLAEAGLSLNYSRRDWMEQLQPLLQPLLPKGLELASGTLQTTFRLPLAELAVWKPELNLPAPPRLPALPAGSALKLNLGLEKLRLPGLDLPRLTLQAALSEDGQSLSASLGSDGGKAGQFSWTKAGLNLEAGLGDTPRLNLEAALDGPAHGRVKAGWTPRLITLTELNLKNDPNGLGLILSAPARIDLPESGLGLSVAAPGLRLKVLPQGNLELAGAWSTNNPAARLQAKADVNLAAWRGLLAQLPSGQAKAELSLEGSPASPRGKASLALSSVSLPPALLEAVPGLPPELRKGVDATLSADLAPAPGGASLTARVSLPSLKALGLSLDKAEASLPLNVAANALPSPAPDRPLTAKLSLSGRLAPLWRLLPLADRRLNGALNLEAALSGTLAAPELNGSLHIRDGHYLDLPLGLEITAIQGSLDLNPQKLGLQLSAADGRKGGLEISGDLRLPPDLAGLAGLAALADPALQGEMRADIKGRLNGFAPLRRSDLNLTFSGDMAASGPLNEALLFARITLDEGEIRIDSLPGASVTVLPVQSAEEAQAQAEQGSAGPGLLAGARLDAQLAVPRRLFVRGRGLESEWQGQITATGNPVSPSLAGRLSSVRGNLAFLGRQFALSRGLVTFSGGFIPILDIALSSRISSAFTALVQVSGPADSPVLTLSGEPPLPRDEVLAQILFGQSGQKLNEAQALQMAGALAALAGMGNGGAGILDFSRKVLGVDTLRLTSQEGEGGKSNPSLEVGKYLFDNVYVGLEQGLDAASSGVRVDIELYPGIDVEARTTSRGSEVGVQWKKDY